VCHQTVGLVCRRLEEVGIPTLSLTSARDITLAVNPPRAAFVDFPLGHTAGRPEDGRGNRAILKAALQVFTTAAPPSTLVDLPFAWTDDDAWKDTVLRPDRSRGETEHRDDRRPRHDMPQYEDEADARAAAETHAETDLIVSPGIDY
jgi:hypothetical protein